MDEQDRFEYGPDGQHRLFCKCCLYRKQTTLVITAIREDFDPEW